MKILNQNIDLQKFFGTLRRGALLILDYDGTLAPLVQNRMQATPYPGVKERLLALLELEQTRLVIVSGRSLSDLETLLGLPSSLELWGSHGLERKRQDPIAVSRFNVPLDFKIDEGLKQGLKVCQEQADPAMCEVKPYAVALHLRGIDPLKQSEVSEPIERAWEKICSNYDLEIHHFDGGIELRPKGRNKGDVIVQLLSEVPAHTPIAYLGDDATDEEAFAALGNKGLKVLVREQLRRPTYADIHLIPPLELLAFLDDWKKGIT